MPFAVTLIKLALFALWGRTTYKMTVEMLEIRERRHGILPPEDDTPKTTQPGAASPSRTQRKPTDKP